MPPTTDSLHGPFRHTAEHALKLARFINALAILITFHLRGVATTISSTFEKGLSVILSIALVLLLSLHEVLLSLSGAGELPPYHTIDSLFWQEDAGSLLLLTDDFQSVTLKSSISPSEAETAVNATENATETKDLPSIIGDLIPHSTAKTRSLTRFHSRRNILRAGWHIFRDSRDHETVTGAYITPCTELLEPNPDSSSKHDEIQLLSASCE